MTARRLVPLSGVLWVVLIVIAFIVGGETPDGDAKLAKIVSFYRDNDTDQIVAGPLLAYAAFFVLVFANSIGNALRRVEGDEGGTARLAAIGGTVFAVGILIFAGLTFTLGDLADD